MSLALSTTFCSERKEIFPLHFLVSFTIKLDHVEKRIHLKILHGRAHGSHFAHINLLGASHLISPVEFIRVCISVTAIFKFPVIRQQEPCPPLFFSTLYFLPPTYSSSNDASTMQRGCLPSLLHKK